MNTLQGFIQDISDCFIFKTNLLSLMFKTGYPDYQNLQKELIVMNMYLWMLPKLGNDYALTEEQVSVIIASMLKTCRRIDIEKPNSNTVVSGTPLNPGLIINNYYTTIINNNALTFTMGYSGIGHFAVTVNHNLHKVSPTVVVTDTSGLNRVRVYPAIVETDENQLILYFNSTSSGIITCM